MENQRRYNERDQSSRSDFRQPVENWTYKGVEYSDTWVKTRIDDKAVDFAEAFAVEELVDKKNGISTSQFRNIYGEIKRIQLKGFSNEKTAFHLLKPKIAYAVKRQETKGAKKFKELINKMHKAVGAETEGAEDRYKNFCDFIEALLAFHKANGGKN